MSCKTIVLLLIALLTVSSPPDMTVADVAACFGITTRTVHMWIAKGRLRAYRVGPKLIRFRRDEIDALLQPFGDGAA